MFLKTTCNDLNHVGSSCEGINVRTSKNSLFLILQFHLKWVSNYNNIVFNILIHVEFVI